MGDSGGGGGGGGGVFEDIAIGNNTLISEHNFD